MRVRNFESSVRSSTSLRNLIKSDCVRARACLCGEKQCGGNVEG